MAFALDARAATNSQHGCACDGLLPALERSRLFLFAPYYRNSEGRVREGGELAVDVAEHLFKAQLLFVLEGEVESKSKYARWAAKRANLLFDEVAPELRQGAYLEAVSDFGAHRLAMANEMRRLMRAPRPGERIRAAFWHPRCLWLGCGTGASATKGITREGTGKSRRPQIPRAAGAEPVVP